jgi:hypothetical protein
MFYIVINNSTYAPPLFYTWRQTLLSFRISKQLDALFACPKRENGTNLEISILSPIKDS